MLRALRAAPLCLGFRMVFTDCFETIAKGLLRYRPMAAVTNLDIFNLQRCTIHQVFCRSQTRIPATSNLSSPGSYSPGLPCCPESLRMTQLQTLTTQRDLLFRGIGKFDWAPLSQHTSCSHPAQKASVQGHQSKSRCAQARTMDIKSRPTFGERKSKKIQVPHKCASDRPARSRAFLRGFGTVLAQHVGGQGGADARTPTLKLGSAVQIHLLVVDPGNKNVEQLGSRQFPSNVALTFGEVDFTATPFRARPRAPKGKKN